MILFVHFEGLQFDFGAFTYYFTCYVVRKNVKFPRWIDVTFFQHIICVMCERHIYDLAYLVYFMDIHFYFCRCIPISSFHM